MVIIRIHTLIGIMDIMTHGIIIITILMWLTARIPAITIIIMHSHAIMITKAAVITTDAAIQ